jgi:transposase
VTVGGAELVDLPEDSESLKAVVRSLLQERDREAQRAESEAQRADEQRRRADEQKLRAEQLHIEMLRLQRELERYKKWYYGPRADRLASSGDVAQMLLDFADGLDRKPVHPGDVPPAAEPVEELRRVRRRKGRRNLANFENLPVTTHTHELNAEQRACPCCGIERKQIGADESWQIEYFPGHFERIHHLRMKYACPACENNGANPSIETAAKPETAIDKGLAGPGLLAYIVTSKFSDYRVPRTHQLQMEVWSCVGDEGRSLGACDQEPAPNLRELLSLRAMVVSVAEKAGQIARQVRSRETSASKPSMNCRKRIDDVETGGDSRSGISKSGDLKTGSCGIRLEGGVNLDQALTRNVGTCRRDAKGASRAGDPRQALSTDAGHRGRTARSRDEGAVMALDRRGCGVQSWRVANQ